MLANKENVLIHGPAHGTGKINPKTPGPSKLNPKTPFKITLNDDKLKTGKNDLFAGRDPSMFVTPAGPRRAALTGKTTNAKARVPRSGGGGGDDGQKSLQKSGRPLRTRLSITTETRPVLNEGGEVPEVEYMPPRELPLVDIPEDFQIPNYAKLSAHIYTDCHRSFLYDIDENGRSAIERQVEASDRQIDALLDAETEMMLKECKPKRTTVVKKATPATGPSLKHKRSTTLTDKPVLTKKRTVERPASAASNNSINSRPSTAASIRAATALSQRPSSSASANRPATSTSQRSHTRSTSTSILKKPAFSRGAEPTQPAFRTSRPNSRMAAANSKTTIGYTTGKEVARTIKKVLELPKMETALEICERILKEDEERQNAVPVLILKNEEQEEEEEEEEVDDILKSLGPMVEDDEEDFFIKVPGLE